MEFIVSGTTYTVASEWEVDGIHNAEGAKLVTRVGKSNARMWPCQSSIPLLPERLRDCVLDAFAGLTDTIKITTTRRGIIITVVAYAGDFFITAPSPTITVNYAKIIGGTDGSTAVVLGMGRGELIVVTYKADTTNELRHMDTLLRAINPSELTIEGGPKGTYVCGSDLRYTATWTKLTKITLTRVVIHDTTRKMLAKLVAQSQISVTSCVDDWGIFAGPQ